MAIDFRKAKFLLSSVDERSFKKDRPIVLFIGRSNVGKSSLINAICDNRHLMAVSKTAGRTTMMNYLDLEGLYYVVDAPGYGFAGRKDFTDLLSSFILFAHKSIKGIYWLIDPIKDLKGDDIELAEMLSYYQVKTRIVITKIDKLNVKESKKGIEKVTKAFGETYPIFTCSSTSKDGLKELKGQIAKDLQALN